MSTATRVVAEAAPATAAVSGRRAGVRGRVGSILVAAALVAIVGWTVASRAAFGILPLGPDQGLYITIGEIIKHGGVPWRDAWDNKPPGTYYLYAAALAAGPDDSQECTLTSRFIPTDGFHTRCAQIVLTAIDTLWTLATVAAVWWIGRRMFGPSVGVVAALLCAYFISMAAIGHGGNTPDSLAVLPGTLAVAATLSYAESGRRRWLVLAGAGSGCRALQANRRRGAGQPRDLGPARQAFRPARAPGRRHRHVRRHARRVRTAGRAAGHDPADGAVERALRGGVWPGTGATPGRAAVVQSLHRLAGRPVVGSLRRARPGAPCCPRRRSTQRPAPALGSGLLPGPGTRRCRFF